MAKDPEKLEEFYYYYGPEKSLVRFERSTQRYFHKLLKTMIEKQKPHDHDIITKTCGYGMEITKEEYDTGVIKLPSGV